MREGIVIGNCNWKVGTREEYLGIMRELLKLILDKKTYEIIIRKWGEHLEIVIIKEYINTEYTIKIKNRKIGISGNCN